MRSSASTPPRGVPAWLMGDYLGNVLLGPRTLEPQPMHSGAACEMIRQTQQEYGIEDLVVTIERTGNHHLAPKRAFAEAGFETRVGHPFATKQYRVPADPGNKTGFNDLFAQHRAAVAGSGLVEFPRDEAHQRLRPRARHRRQLVQKSSALACQIRDHLLLAMPGYAARVDGLQCYLSPALASTTTTRFARKGIWQACTRPILAEARTDPCYWPSPACWPFT